MAEPGPLCIYEKRDPHIAIIKLNRPEKKNAISRDLYWALDAAWQKAKADDDVIEEHKERRDEAQARIDKLTAALGRLG